MSTQYLISLDLRHPRRLVLRLADPRGCLPLPGAGLGLPVPPAPRQVLALRPGASGGRVVTRSQPGRDRWRWEVRDVLWCIIDYLYIIDILL